MPKIFKVGGCVRDEIMGLESKDIDFTFVLDNLDQTVEQGFQDMTDHLIKEGFEIFLSTPDCFTIRARFPKTDKGGLVADFVLARKETGYVEGTRRPILTLGTLHDDLIRRDFTVNAIAIDEDGNLIDPFLGVEDIKKKILITPLDPTITLMDDPLRLLRALRFAITKKFKISQEILDAMKQPALMEKLQLTVSGERIREEILKMMAADTPNAFRLLSVMDDHIPGFLEVVFGKGLWLKPTFEKI
jgi:tRNA nucleotidyltransferase/poly(A) polymerase